MTKKEHRYRPPSKGQCYLMSVFFDQIYRDRYQFGRWSIINLDKKRPSWSNTAEAMRKQYRELYGNIDGFEDISSDMIRIYIKDLEKNGVLLKQLNNHRAISEFRYYPNETTEGYLALLDYVLEDYRRGSFPNKEFSLDPLYGAYSDMVLNRQFVLDTLKRNMDYIRTSYNGELVDIPLVGRYKKNYETKDRLTDMIDVLDKIGSVINDSKNKGYRKVMEIVEDDIEPTKDPNFRLNRKKRESNLKMIDDIKRGLLEEIEFMEMYRRILEGKAEDSLWENFSDRLMDEYQKHIDNIAPNYPRFGLDSIFTSGLSFYRQEANWLDICLTGDEKERLESISEGLSEFYVDWIDENIVMPILCLIQMSPNALYGFTRTNGWIIPERVYSYSCDNAIRDIVAIKAAKSDPVKEKYLLQDKEINTLLHQITRIALIDYISGNIRTSRGTDNHKGDNRTTLKSFGWCCLNVEEEERVHYPALFTFTVYKEYTVSIYVSENPGYNVFEDITKSYPDDPYPLIYDWAPAVGISYKQVNSPYVRGNELLNLINSSGTMDDVCLRGILSRAILSGRM